MKHLFTFFFLGSILIIYAQQDIAVIYNTNSETSAIVASYYNELRQDRVALTIGVDCTTDEVITDAYYNSYIRDVVRQQIDDSGFKYDLKYLVTTKGMPLKIIGTATGCPPVYKCWSYQPCGASLESTLNLLYQNFELNADSVANPYYGVTDEFRSFTYTQDNYTVSYLVTRLDAYTLGDIIQMLDRAISSNTTGTGIYLLDDDNIGYDRMPQARDNLINMGLGDYVIYDGTTTNVTSINGNPDLIAYCGHGQHASYGNPPYNPFMGWTHPTGYLGMSSFSWLNGAIFNTYESFNAWSFYYEDDGCTYGEGWGQILGHAAHQNLIADFFKDGGTCAVGHVFEPFASNVANEAILFPQYASGKEFGEAAWASITRLRWVNTVVGDPVCIINEGEFRGHNIQERKETELLINYPNPFNPTTRISFSLAVDSKVSLKIFDVLGQEVASLVNQDLTQGIHTYDFNASGINSGVYFYKIEATGVNGNEFIDVKKMILVK